MSLLTAAKRASSANHDIKADFPQLYLNGFCYKFNRRFFGFKLFDRLELCAPAYRADSQHRCY